MKLKQYYILAIAATLLAANTWSEVYVTESFTGTSANGWSFTAGPSPSTGASLTAASGLDADGEGWLRLTQDEEKQSSFVYYNQPLSTAQGLVFEFDFVIWASAYRGDGFTLAIFDANASPDIGGLGGSLGYAQRSGINGLNGGIVGFGFDAFGNYSVEDEGRVGGPGKSPNTIAIRGSMGTDRSLGYEYITGSAPNLGDFSESYASNRNYAVVHTVRITIPTDKQISIEWKIKGATDYTTLIDKFQCSLNCPDNVMFGFTGATASLSANQEIRNLSVSSISAPASSGIDLRAYQAADGVYVEFIARDVEADGTIMLALMNATGEVVWQDLVDVSAGPEYCARFLVPGLELDGSYDFQVRDEVGKWWQANGVMVQTFATEMVSASLTDITLSFDSLPEHDYEIQWVPTLGSPWQTVTNLTAPDAQTTIVVPHPDPEGDGGFFRVQLK